MKPQMIYPMFNNTNTIIIMKLITTNNLNNFLHYHRNSSHNSRSLIRRRDSFARSFLANTKRN